MAVGVTWDLGENAALADAAISAMKRDVTLRGPVRRARDRVARGRWADAIREGALAVRRRVLARRLCASCGMDYNLIAHRPQSEGTCDVCGGELVSRADDNPEALAIRLSDYHKQTRPLIEIFQRKEYVATIDATQSVNDVQDAIRERFALPRAS